MNDAPNNSPDEFNASGEYRVLARKYRPSSFDDLIGQEPMVQTLSNAFKTGRIAQAYMLTGVRGVGKTTTARILARALNYETDGITAPTLDLAEPGIHCPSIMEGNHVDVIEMDAASHTGIGDIREIIAAVRYKPVSARYKVYIIDEVHMLSTAAFNGLLKTLEEPPEHVKFIFATTEIRKVPITVLSRCQRFDLRRIEAGELVAHLDKIIGLEEIVAEPEALAMIARAAEGSVRDALSILDQGIAHADGASGGKVLALDIRSMLGLADRARVVDLFEHVMKGEIKDALLELKAQYDVGADPATVLSDLAEFTHFVTRVRYVASALDDPSLSPEEKARGQEFADQLSPRVLGRTWQMLLKGIREVQNAPRPMAAADMVLVRLTHAADLPTPDEVLQKLANHSSGPSAHSSASGRPEQTVADAGPSRGGGDPAIAESSPGLSTPPAPTMQRAGNGSKLATQTAALAEPVAEAQPNIQVVRDKIESFADLLSLAEKKRDIKFKLMMRNNFSEISFQNGRIEFSPVGNAPRDMVQTLQSRLREWTGKPWEIISTENEGQATLKQQEEAYKAELLEDAERDPVVSAVLSMFSRSKIIDVRFPGAVDGLAEADAAEAALEDPDQSSLDSQDPGVGDLDDYFQS